MSSTPQLFEETGAVLLPGQGQVIPLLSNTATVKVSGDDTAGQLTVIEYEIAPGGPSPVPHRHKYVEVFYLLTGSLTFTVDGQEVIGAAGTTITVPAGVVHTYRNESPEPVRFLVICAPAGIDKYFAELAQLIEAEPVWPPRDTSRIMALNEKYDTELVVPSR